MITIGIRAAPKVVTYAIYDTAEDALINVDEIKIPAAFAVPEALKYVRSNLLDILREYKVEKAGIRTTEGLATPNVERIHLEGVIQEAFASSELQSYYIGQISSITKLLGIERENFKPLADGKKDPGVENWDKMGKEKREAILCAMGAKNA